MEEILATPPNKLVEKLENGELSILQMFGVSYFGAIKRLLKNPTKAEKLRFSAVSSWKLQLFVMNWLVGPMCRFLLWCILVGDNKKSENYWQKKRQKAVKLGHILFPDKIQGTITATESQGLIVGFNHPTLHEILSLITWSLENFPNKRNNFPTNLPWYESVCTCADSLRNLGICIAPLITQGTFAKLEKIHEGDSETIKAMAKISNILLNNYLTIATEFDICGDNTFSAPSGTRQATIFANKAAFDNDNIKLLPVMSSLALKIARANKTSTSIFLPITVIPPKFWLKNMRGLRLLNSYQLVIGKGFSVDEVKTLGRKIDYAFLQRIAENAPKRLIYP
ncbi:MAG: hypothetical protein FWG64_01355 [Firmicutes bacterium]|nr:hypothetical protein [Bacillota bacterium]